MEDEDKYEDYTGRKEEKEKRKSEDNEWKQRKMRKWRKKSKRTCQRKGMIGKTEILERGGRDEKEI